MCPPIYLHDPQSVATLDTADGIDFASDYRRFRVLSLVAPPTSRGVPLSLPLAIDYQSQKLQKDCFGLPPSGGVGGTKKVLCP